MDKLNKLSFEEALVRLDEIVRKLERGEAMLSESVGLYEEGARLAAHCGGLLEKAEQLVVKLGRDAEGQVSEIPFESE